MTKNVDAIRRLFIVDASRDHTGNLPSLPGIYPDYSAPIVRNAAVVNVRGRPGKGTTIEIL